MSKHQRYVSQELTHFVGARLPNGDAQYALLVEILRTGLLKTPGLSDVIVESGKSGPRVTTKVSFTVNHGKKLSSNDKYCASIVCFADIPIEDLPFHMAKYSQFGLALTKRFLVAAGANPVFYIASQSSTDIHNPLANNPQNFDHVSLLAESNRNRGLWCNFTRAELFDAADKEHSKIFSFRRLQPPDVLPSEDLRVLEQFFTNHLFPFMKFFDSDLEERDRRNYYMEREWRVIGAVKFDISDVERILIPKAYAQRFRQDIPSYLGQVTFADEEALDLVDEAHVRPQKDA